MRPLGWALVKYDWCPYKKETFGDRNRHKGKMDVSRVNVKTDVKTDDWSKAAKSQDQRLLAHRKLGSIKEGFPGRFQRETALTP